MLNVIGLFKFINIFVIYFFIVLFGGKLIVCIYFSMYVFEVLYYNFGVVYENMLMLKMWN